MEFVLQNLKHSDIVRKKQDILLNMHDSLDFVFGNERNFDHVVNSSHNFCRHLIAGNLKVRYPEQYECFADHTCNYHHNSQYLRTLCRTWMVFADLHVERILDRWGFLPSHTYLCCTWSLDV